VGLRFWLVVVAAAGVASTAAAAAFLWLLITQPVRAAELVSRAF
jgi:hypothetical protein